MGALVQYRDLPGGPTQLLLCDELSRHCMCTNCGMLSMSMLQDPNEHMFCETCLMERSLKFNSNHIYCSHENREVDVFEMFEAANLITVIQDQLAECPNPECKKHVPLKELKEHYTQCKPAVMCSTCQQQVRSADWSDHDKNCNKQEAGRTQSTGAIRKQFPPKDALPYPNSSPSFKRDSNQNTRETSSLYPSLQDAQSLQQISRNEGPDKMTLCPHCKRKLKERNLDRHLQACSKVPQPCCYCGGKFIPDEIKSHIPMCEKNPDNVPKQKPEKREATNTQVGSGSQVSRGGPPTYAAALKDGKHAGGNHSTINRPQPNVHSQSPVAQCIQSQPRAASCIAQPSYQAAESEYSGGSNCEKEDSGSSGPIPCCKGFLRVFCLCDCGGP